MKADHTPLRPLLEGTRQFVAPLYQRRYSWRRPQWELLWTHVLAQQTVLAEFTATGDEGPVRATHFLGSFVLSPMPGLAADLARFRIVDGQQRISTVLLLLSALRDSVAEDEDATRISESFLLNRFKKGDDRLKTLLTQADRPDMAAVLGGAPDEAAGLLGSGYRYFKNVIEVERTASGEFSLELLEQAIVNRLTVVEISTEGYDNVHRIFQTLNTSGVMLDPVDLIRNHVFMLLREHSDEVYANVWRAMEDELGVQGLDSFLLVDLLRRKGNRERYARKDVYRAYQEELEPIEHDEGEVVEFLAGLSNRAGVYAWILDPSGVEDEGVRRRLERLKEWGTSTVDPLVLHILLEFEAGVIDSSDAAESLRYVESYLVRRLLQKIPTNNLNRIFSEIVPLLPRRDTLPASVRAALSGEGRYWPTDEELRARLVIEEFYKAQRNTQRQFVLRRLEEALPNEVPPDWAQADLSVEHIMPQQLTEEWIAELRANGDDNPIDMHNELVHTLGNLTLTQFNPELGQRAFADKVELMFEKGPLELTRELFDSHGWGREQIEARSRRLGELAIEIWPGPVEGAAGSLQIGDWSQVEAALGLLNTGQWTTYGDLAELSNMGATTVQDRLYDEILANRHRVLLSSGKVDARAPWARDDVKGYVELLVSEGVLSSTADTSGDPEARVGAGELAELLGEQ